MASALKAIDIGKSERAIANSVIIIFFILIVSFQNIPQNLHRDHIAYQTQPSGHKQSPPYHLRFHGFLASSLTIK
jgi:hypothetical protein